MKIEDVIKSSSTLSLYKKTILNILYTQNVISEKINEVFKQYDISVEQFNVLRILRGQKGNPANMFLIQERMLSKTSNTTRLVDKLLLKGLVTREVCEKNRRKIEIMITKEGLDLLFDLDPKLDEYEKGILNGLSDEQLTEMNAILDHIRENNFKCPNS